MTKTCPSCKETKALSNFWKGQCYCVPCQKDKQKNSWQSRTPKKRLEQHLKFKYKIEYQAFLDMWFAQDGCCAICSTELPDLMVYENRRRGYAIDHNHETMEVRGILCLNCNSLLGMANDDAVVLERAISYLQNRGSYAVKKSA
jgi:hypothetical protein